VGQVVVGDRPARSLHEAETTEFHGLVAQVLRGSGDDGARPRGEDGHEGRRQDGVDDDEDAAAVGRRKAHESGRYDSEAGDCESRLRSPRGFASRIDQVQACSDAPPTEADACASRIDGAAENRSKAGATRTSSSTGMSSSTGFMAMSG